jgi:hypothetical protein
MRLLNILILISDDSCHVKLGVLLIFQPTKMWMENGLKMEQAARVQLISIVKSRPGNEYGEHRYTKMATEMK